MPPGNEGLERSKDDDEAEYIEKFLPWATIIKMDVWAGVGPGLSFHAQGPVFGMYDYLALVFVVVEQDRWNQGIVHMGNKCGGQRGSKEATSSKRRLSEAV